MAPGSSALTTSLTYPFFFIFLVSKSNYASSCYTSIFGFGDSITDTGNLLLRSPPNDIPHMGLPPYGETFFHHPTGRCSDGRLVIDFLAEYYGLPLVPPSSAVKNANSTAIRTGVNFAVVGAPALDLEFYWERGISDPETNDSLRIQLNQFKELLPSLCDSSSSCKRLLKQSLILGHFGGNDYTHSFLSGKGIDDILPFVPLITKAIASAINELVKLGAMTIVVPGMLPIGCASSYLTEFPTQNAEEYDQSGCLIWLNELAEYHDELLHRELQQTRELHPHANIVFADFYNSAMQLYRFPTKYGFTGNGILSACCGTGGPYNYNSSAPCGLPPSTGCDDPSLYVNWDGYHLTEAAYRWIFKGILDGPYAVPPLNSLMSSCDHEKHSIFQPLIAQA
ncbi:hypothetical protein ACH5RR_015268 [Cinchona calisaya]|uniref:Uncharacterized protein n=1 Tax=Cinchona calisaya TaxID=153742 RepID=A0ABD2ZSQ7_9GENT